MGVSSTLVPVRGLGIFTYCGTTLSKWSIRECGVTTPHYVVSVLD